MPVGKVTYPVSLAGLQQINSLENTDLYEDLLTQFHNDKLVKLINTDSVIGYYRPM